LNLFCPKKPYAFLPYFWFLPDFARFSWFDKKNAHSEQKNWKFFHIGAKKLKIFPYRGKNWKLFIDGANYSKFGTKFLLRWRLNLTVPSPRIFLCPLQTS
jgi:hypothetical protein